MTISRVILLPKASIEISAADLPDSGEYDSSIVDRIRINTYMHYA